MMRVAVTGASGLIGTALVAALRADGHQVVRLVRGQSTKPAPDEVRWNPQAGYVDLDGLAGVDGVVHLAGAGVGDRPWTPARKRVIRDSRVDGTRTIATALTQLDPKPNVLVSASAIGYYGDSGDTEVDETSPPGEGFLASVVVDWEAAAAPARAAGIRVAHPRTGLVMTRRGGILPKLALPFKLGLGGRLGSGRQYSSVISLADEVAALQALLIDDSVEGAVNLCCPQPLTNADFTTALARAIGKPARLMVPGLLLGRTEQTREMLLFGQRARPAVLERRGFAFAHQDAESVIDWALAN